MLNQDELAAIQFDVHSDKQELTEASYVFEQAQIIFGDNHSVSEKYIQSALEREKFSSTLL